MSEVDVYLWEHGEHKVFPLAGRIDPETGHVVDKEGKVLVYSEQVDPRRLIPREIWGRLIDYKYLGHEVIPDPFRPMPHPSRGPILNPPEDQ